MKKLTVIAAMLLCVFSSTIAWAQAPKAQIVIEALSPDELLGLGWTSHPSNGLRVVGKGELVYLSGRESAGQQVTNFAWSLTGPTGSTATLDSLDKPWTTLTPDITGDFVVQLTITTAGGTAQAAVTITSAEYVGVGIVEELATDAGKASCSPCHTGIVKEWVQTGHPTIFREGIDGIASSHYGESCIECHVLGYNTSPTAVNGGFDDVAASVGWTFPTVLQAGNYQNLITNYPALGKMASIQCENCHGPASAHKTTFSKTKMDVTLDEGLCGRCHEEAPYHRRSTQWKNSGHSIGIASAAGRAGCADCHSGYGFIHKVDPNTGLDPTLGFPQVTCQVCHDPHSIGHDPEHQVRKLDDVTLNNGVVISFGGSSKLCMNCHMGRRNAEEYVKTYSARFGPHYCNQTDMLAGTNAIDFGIYLPNSTHRDVLKDGCVTCHMSATPGANQPGRDFLGEHSFALHWDGGTPDDPSDDIDHVAVCKNCHGDITKFEDIKAREDYDGDGSIEGARAELHGLLDKVAMLLPPLGEPTVTVTSAYTPLQLKAAFNYLFVEEDGSEGMHNYQYAINLLKVSLNALKYGILSPGSIGNIVDVPNDQGKQVRIDWSRFGADGVTHNPVQLYAIWRRVDDLGAKAAGKVYNSLESVSAEQNQLANGARVQIYGKMWDFVGSVPASALDNYSTVVPTLFDSNKVDGQHWSVFYVSGHTANAAVFAASEPDSGYSKDNLAPASPANVLGQEIKGGVQLSWDESADEDFKYFAIYRSTTAGFDPSTLKPVTTLTENTFTDLDVMTGQTYYYRLSAFDFNGNQSAFSGEVSTMITGVDGAGIAGVPQDFMLLQNYPNPFNPSTEISFGLPRAEEVTLAVYNMQGKLVRTLVKGKFSTGYHNFSWDARDDNGTIVSAGMYIYRLETQSMTLTKKMILLK